MVVLEVLFLLLEPAIEARLSARRDFRLVLAGAAVERRQQALAGRVDVRQHVLRQVALGRILRADIVAVRGGQRLARIEAGIAPVVHLVGFERREILIFLGEGLRERVAPGRSTVRTYRGLWYRPRRSSRPRRSPTIFSVFISLLAFFSAGPARRLHAHARHSNL